MLGSGVGIIIYYFTLQQAGDLGILSTIGKTLWKGQTMNKIATVVGPFVPIHSPAWLEGLIYSFLNGRNESTIRAYGRDLDCFRAFTKTTDLDEAAQLLFSHGHGPANALALAYKAYLIEQGLQATTINRRLAALRSLAKMARTLGFIPWTLEVQNVKGATPYRDTRGPGRSAVQRLFDTNGNRLRPKALRDQAAIRLLYDLGLRRAEVVSLDLADVDLGTSKLSVLGKGRSQKHLLSLPEPTKAALTAWLEVRGPEAGPLFTNFDRASKGRRLTGTSLYRIVRALGARIGLEIRPHGLRHTAITEACKAAQTNGVGLEEVLQFSRHKDVRTLMIYRDRERDVQGQLAACVAGTAEPLCT